METGAYVRSYQPYNPRVIDDDELMLPYNNQGSIIEINVVHYLLLIIFASHIYYYLGTWGRFSGP